METVKLINCIGLCITSFNIGILFTIALHTIVVRHADRTAEQWKIEIQK